MHPRSAPRHRIASTAFRDSRRHVASHRRTPAVARQLGPLLALMLAVPSSPRRSDRFLTGDNLSLVVQQVMVVGTLAIGQTLIILTGGIDLSCGAVMALGTIVMAKLAVNSACRRTSRSLLGFAGVRGFGCVNGLLVTRIRCRPSSSRWACSTSPSR